MGKINKLDSFLKEAQRVYGTVGVCKLVLGTLYCFALKTAQSECVVTQRDFVLSDGIVVPVGTEIAVAAFATNTDEVNYA